MWALRIHRLSIRRCCELPRRSACLALRTSSQWRPCVTGLAVRKRSRGGLQHPLHGVLGDVANCPGVPLVWPCVLPQWRPCVTGLAVRKRSRGGLQHRVPCILETLLWIAPASPLSGLAFFLSGDLAPQDMWKSKKIEKAVV
jgi:hypothetical protein